MVKPEILVNPEKSLRDELVKISVLNVEPHAHITLEATSKDRFGNVWTSQAIFEANDKGVIDISTQEPLEGSYSGIDPMGLFWSMTPKNKNTSMFFGRFEVLLSAYFNNEIIAQKTIHRDVVSSDIEQKQIREDGLVGTLLYSKKILKGPAIIVLSGSDGGVPFYGHTFASHGYVVFALGYFGAEGLPENLENINLEYFQKAMHWLKKQPIVNGDIALMGVSRGGELVLLLGSIFPGEMKAIISYVPSDIVYGGLPNQSKPAWVYKNSPIPFMPYPSDEEIMNGIKEGKIPNNNGTYKNPYELTPIFLYGLEKYKDMVEETTISVENISCPLLIISGEDDKMWPSSLYGKLVMERLQKKESKIERKHLLYPNAGHMLNRPFLPSIDLPLCHPQDKSWYAMGGTAKGNAYANQESWKEVLNFLKKTLKK